MNSIKDLPIELQERLCSFNIVEVIEGRIGDRIVKLTDEREALYLKISSTKLTQTEMESECKILEWLSSTELNIPKVLYFIKNSSCSYMLLSNVLGLSAHKLTENFSRAKVVEISAKALLNIHSVNTQFVPLNYTNCLEQELESIIKNVEDNKINIESFKKANNNKTPQSVLEYLLKNKRMFTADVFTHGDYCLPNILIDNDFNYGFVDWAQAGIADIYRDISPMVKSINRNFGSEYSKLFLKYYGIAENEINYEKITYYDLIDQFTYFKKPIE